MAFKAKHIPADEKQRDKLLEITRLLLVLNAIENGQCDPERLKNKK